MNKRTNSVKIALAIAVIVGVVAWLAVSGFESNKSYYVTIPELGAWAKPVADGGIGNLIYKRHLRIEGFVVPGSIVQNGTHVDFLLNEFESHTPDYPKGRTLRVRYSGAEPPPDTFKDDSQALAEGTYTQDGHFQATGLSAKCASKYAPAQPDSKPAGS